MEKERAVSTYSLAYIIVSNAILLFLIAWVFEDYAYRASYWREMGFTPSTTYWPFLLQTSATNGVTTIPGQLTLDWTQVFGAILVIIDVLFVIGVIRGRRKAASRAAEVRNVPGIAP